MAAGEERAVCVEDATRTEEDSAGLKTVYVCVCVGGGGEQKVGTGVRAAKGAEGWMQRGRKSSHVRCGQLSQRGRWRGRWRERSGKGMQTMLGEREGEVRERRQPRRPFGHLEISSMERTKMAWRHRQEKKERCSRMGQWRQLQNCKEEAGKTEDRRELMGMWVGGVAEKRE